MQRYTPLANHVRQMLFENEGEWRFSGSGTCFLLRHGAANYVVTAKHVVNGYSPAQIRVMVNPDLPTGDVNCFPLRQPFTFARYGDEDFEDFVVAPILDNNIDQSNAGLFFPYESVSGCHFSVTATNRIVVAGYPDENQEVDYEREQISGQATLALASDIGLRGADLMYELTLGSDCGLSSFSGFSGSPVFSHSADSTVRVIGVVLRGGAQCRKLRFLDIRAVVGGIEHHTRIQNREGGQ
mgnify:FL=1